MDMMGLAGVAVITIICYLAAKAVKALGMATKWLPVVCSALGGVLGVVAMYVMPNYPGTDILTAVARGIVSGLAAPGANQIINLKKANDRQES